MLMLKKILQLSLLGHFVVSIYSTFFHKTGVFFQIFFVDVNILIIVIFRLVCT